MRVFFPLFFALALLSYAGCQPASTPESSDEETAATAVKDIQDESTAEEASEGTADASESGNAESDAAVENETAENVSEGDNAGEENASASEDEGKSIKADVGVGKKGDFVESPEQPMAIVSVPLATYFRAQDQMTFRNLIPHAMDLYKAENGEFPKTSDQFWNDIIKANNIKLPELPEGDEYYYDPATAQLMVRTHR